jgi:mono/diheme cytochrome c family protein
MRVERFGESGNRVIDWTIAFVVVAGLAAAASGQTAGTEATVRDKVYSQDQAKRGRASYDGKCASCHDGGTMGPELWGDAFLTQWENKDVASFYTRIQETMPEDAPGTLGEKEVLDIIAYVVQTNGFPAGDKEIESKDALAKMTFVKKQ